MWLFCLIFSIFPTFPLFRNSASESKQTTNTRMERRKKCEYLIEDILISSGSRLRGNVGVHERSARVLEPDENSESWQENRTNRYCDKKTESCSSFDLQPFLLIHNVFFQQNKHLLLNKLVCRSKDEQDMAIRFSCHDSEFSSGSGSPMSIFRSF